MRLVIGAFYIEPGYSLSVSHKVMNFMREELIKHIMERYRLADQNPDWFLSIDAATDSKTTYVQVKGPDENKRSKFINYAIWLPYRQIEKSPDVHTQFLKYFFDGLVTLFSRWNVKEADLRNVQSIVEKEVLGNSNYVFEEESIPPPDLSDIDFNAV